MTSYFNITVEENPTGSKYKEQKFKPRFAIRKADNKLIVLTSRDMGESFYFYAFDGSYKGSTVIEAEDVYCARVLSEGTRIVLQNTGGKVTEGKVLGKLKIDNEEYIVKATYVYHLDEVWRYPNGKIEHKYKWVYGYVDLNKLSKGWQQIEGTEAIFKPFPPTTKVIITVGPESTLIDNTVEIQE